MTEHWRLVNGKELYDIKADPGQKKDVADKRADVVAKLRRQYEQWWADVSERFDEYCETIVGSDKENPTRLTSHDWHVHGPWNQEQIRLGLKNNSFWAVEVARDGDYEISLRRWPQEANTPIRAAVAGGTAIKPAKARLKIAGFDKTKDIPENAVAVTFSARLKAGKTRLQTWFIDDDGKSRGAYYVYVKRLN